MSIAECNNIIAKNRDKWREVPATLMDRMFSSDLMVKSDSELISYWDMCRQQHARYDVKGWFHDIYKYQFEGKRVLDVGSGIGIDGITFAENGAKVTFADIVSENQTLLKRICALKGISAEFYYIDDCENFKFETKFDAITAIGSLHHIPFELAKKEIAALNEHLIVGGKFCMFTYPKERYEECKCSSFEEFGKKTDGKRTPWAEWYDAEKIQKLFGSNYHLNWWRNFGQSNTEFNWFELSKLSD